MPFDIWVFALNTIKLRKATPLISCQSGEPTTNDDLITAEIEIISPVKTREEFLCKDAVDTLRILQIVRKGLMELGNTCGANALVDEQWSCKIYQKGKRSYLAKIEYSANVAKAWRSNSGRPVSTKEIKGIPGIMTILEQSYM